MTPNERDILILRLAGETLFGPSWKRDLATAIGVHEKTMQRWAVGKTPISQRYFVLISKAIERRQSDLARLLPIVQEQGGLISMHLRKTDNILEKISAENAPDL